MKPYYLHTEISWQDSGSNQMFITTLINTGMMHSLIGCLTHYHADSRKDFNPPSCTHGRGFQLTMYTLNRIPIQHHAHLKGDSSLPGLMQSEEKKKRSLASCCALLGIPSTRGYLSLSFLIILNCQNWRVRRPLPLITEGTLSPTQLVGSVRSPLVSFLWATRVICSHTFHSRSGSEQPLEASEITNVLKTILYII